MPQNPQGHDKEMREVCLEYFRNLDGYIERLVKLAGPDAQVFFERREATLNREIAAIRISTQPLSRRERQISKREAEIADNRRMIVVAAYNTAVSYLNLARKDEALLFAKRIMDDDEFGERARALAARIRPDEQR